MPYYVMLTNLTDDGRKTIKVYPRRIQEVTEEVEGKGVKVLAQYALLGQYDFCNILEAPDDETISRVAVELSARGTLQTLTMSAIPLSDFIASLEK
jgi:uncharacterized protein with GYD domain